MGKIAINGFSRVGRASLKVIPETPGLEVVAVNDLMSIENAPYLFKYDSVFGGEVNFNDNNWKTRESINLINNSTRL